MAVFSIVFIIHIYTHMEVLRMSYIFFAVQYDRMAAEHRNRYQHMC